MSQNQNKTVYPIRSKKQIETLKRSLSNSPRNYLLFIFGINSGLRMKDLLNIKVKDVQGKSQGEKVYIKETKTNKTNFYVINRKIHKALTGYFDSIEDLDPDNYLFMSRKGQGQLRMDTASKLVKRWCNDIGIKVNTGARTLRKTFGYHLYKSGTPIEIIQKRFNHSTSSVTLRYIGVDEKQVEDTLNGFNL